MTIQNENLKIDNSSLLQRWIESKNEEAARMNEAFLQEASKQRPSRKVSLSSSEASRTEQKLGSVKGKEKEKEKS